MRSHPPRHLDELFARYLDRLNSGETIDPLQVLYDHPEIGPALLEKLEEFVELNPGPDSDAPLGTLGDYTLRRQIGRGGMGVVYEAWENSMDRRVALKVLPSVNAADTRATTRFLREAQTAGKLNHPNVVGVYSTGVKEGTPWYAMEYVEGETLAHILARIKDAEPETETPFGPKDSAAYFDKLGRAFADVADGLQHAHSKGVTHRDIKPSNLILDQDGRLRILDFGLARLEGQESLTISGDVMGTPLYMSPEQARRKKIPVDHRTDVYSLGATMYEAICGRPPFRGKDHADTLSQIIERDPVEPNKLNTRVSTDLETIVLKCLRKDASDRYGTAEALAQDLRRFVRGDPVEARRPSFSDRLLGRLRRHRTAVVIAAAFLALLSTAAWLAYQREHAETEARLARYEARLARYEASVAELLRSIYAEFTVKPTVEKSKKREFGVLGIRRSRVPWRPEELRELSGLKSRESLESTVESLREISRAFPDKPDAHYHLARALRVLGRTEEARSEFERTLEIAPGFVPATVALRYELRDSRFDAAALEDFQHLPDPDHPWRSRWLDAYLSVKEKRWSEAVSAYDRLLLLERQIEAPYVGFFDEAYLGSGLARLETGDYLGAQRDFIIAGDRLPGFELTILEGKAYYLAGEEKRAEAIFQRVHDRAGDRRDGMALWIAAVYDSLKNYEMALKWVGRIDGSFPIIERLRSHFLHWTGQLDRAIAEGERAIARDGDDLRAHIVLANALGEAVASAPPWQRVGKLSRFLEISRRAVELGPHNRHARLLLGASEAIKQRKPRSQAMRQSLFRRLVNAVVVVSCGIAGNVRADEMENTAPTEPSGFTDARHLDGPVNTGAHEYNPVVSSDGNTLYFVATESRGGFGGSDLWVAMRASEERPFEVVNFQELAAPGAGVMLNGPANDQGAWPHGDLEVYFGSERSGNGDIFLALREAPGEPFTQVVPLGPGVNSVDQEYHPSLTRDGRILVFQRAALGADDRDVWIAERAATDEPFGVAQRAFKGPTPYQEAVPRISGDGLTLIFSDAFGTEHRPGRVGGLDIWGATRSSTEERFETIENLNALFPGTTINSGTVQFSASFSRDWPAPGSKLYFVSGNYPRGTGDNLDIWEADWYPVVPLAPGPHFTNARRLESPVVNTQAHEHSPVVSSDGNTLYFTATESRGGFGEADIWVATRASEEERFEVVNFQELATPGAGVMLNGPSSDFEAWPHGDHEVYFASNRDSGADGVLDSDIFVAIREERGGLFTRVERLGPEINSTESEGAPSLTRDGLILLFSREKSWGDKDIWITERASRDDRFAPARRLDGFSTDWPEYKPRISGDGCTLIFSDEFGRPNRAGGLGSQDIWGATRSSRDQPFGPITNLNRLFPPTDINIGGVQFTPCFSPDWPAPGSKLYFSGGNLPGGVGNHLDIWVADWIVGEPPPRFLRGDCNDDGVVDISDPVYNLEVQFLGKNDSGCLAALDTNADGVMDISDPVYNLEHQFLGKPAPPPPFPGCGPESLPAGDALPCETRPATCP